MSTLLGYECLHFFVFVVKCRRKFYQLFRTVYLVGYNCFHMKVYCPSRIRTGMQIRTLSICWINTTYFGSRLFALRLERWNQNCQTFVFVQSYYIVGVSLLRYNLWVLLPPSSELLYTDHIVCKAVRLDFENHLNSTFRKLDSAYIFR